MCGNEYVWFLRATVLCYSEHYATAIPSVCLSFRLSVRHTRAVYQNGLTYRLNPDRPIILAFRYQELFRKLI